MGGINKQSVFGRGWIFRSIFPSDRRNSLICRKGQKGIFKWDFTLILSVLFTRPGEIKRNVSNLFCAVEKNGTLCWVLRLQMTKSCHFDQVNPTEEKNLATHTIFSGNKRCGSDFFQSHFHASKFMVFSRRIHLIICTFIISNPGGISSHNYVCQLCVFVI